MRRLILAVTTTIVLFLGGLGLQPALAEGYPPCTITGTAANETITGTEGNDVICTGGGNDTVNALGGNDIIIVSGPGIETINGGSGNDTIDATLGTDSSIDAGTGDDTVYGTPGDDEITAGDGSDTVQGAGGADVISGGLGEDNLSGDAGNDTVNGGAGDDTISGGAGNDQLTGEADIDIITGEAGDDNIDAGDGNDDVDGGDGNDTATGGDGNDDINGDAGNDTITGDAGDDTVNGGDGEDTLNGILGDDTLIGGEGSDRVNGGPGNDYLAGSNGNDILFGGVGSDNLLGEGGNDKLSGDLGKDFRNGGAGINLCARDDEDDSVSCTLEVELIDDSVVISGSVRDANGGYVPNVVVSLTDSNSVSHFFMSDSNGLFNASMPKGVYRSATLEVADDGSKQFPDNFRAVKFIEYNLTSDTNFNFVIPATKRIKIHVVDAQGSPVQYARIETCSASATIGVGLHNFGEFFIDAAVWEIPFGAGPRNSYKNLVSTDANGNAFITTFEGVFDLCLEYDEIKTVGSDVIVNRIKQTRTLDARSEPSAPIDLLAGSISNQSFVLSWKQPLSLGGSILDDYTVELSRDDGVSWQSMKSGVSTSTSITVTGAAPGTRYLIRIAALNAVGQSDYLTGSVTTLTTSASAPKSLVSSNLAGTRLSLGWGLPDSNGGSAITDYQVEVTSNGANSWSVIPHTASNSLGFNVTNLLPGRTYQFRVSAVTAAGVGAASNVITVTTLGAVGPNAPATLLVSGVKTNTASLSWSGVVATQKVSNYLVDFSTDGSTWISVSKRVSTSTSLALSGLRLGTTYQVRVAAVNSVGTGSYVYGSFTTLATVSTSPTALVSSSVSSSGFTLNWNAPSSNGGAAITDYVVEINGGGFSWAPVSHEVTGVTSINISGLNPGIKYTVRVKAVNRVGISKASTSLYVTTLATTPGTAKGLTVKSVSATGAVITWTAPNAGGAKISDYLAEVSTDNGQTWKTVVKSASSSTTLTLKGLKTKTSYQIRITAKNSVGYGAVSQNLAVTTP